MPFKTHSIPFKVCVSILFIETVLLTMMGGYYIQRFEREIDLRVKEKLTQPGILMSQRALNFDAVQDRSVISELIQEEVADAFVVKKDGTVFFASDPAKEGRYLRSLLGEKESELLSLNGEVAGQVNFSSERGEKFIVSMTPIHYAEKLLGHLYIKIHADNIEYEKRKVLSLFIFGSLLTIFLTTLLEALFVHRLFVPRIQQISSTLKEVENGNLTAKVASTGPADELCTLSNRVNTMIGAVSANIQEISETKDKLAKSKERLSMLSDLLPETIFEVDIEGKVTYVNQKASELFQYTRDEFQKEIYIWDLLADTDRAQALEMVQARITGNISGITEHTARRKNGEIFPVNVNSSTIYINDNAVGLRGVLIDVTEKKRMGEQLQQAQKMEAISRLVTSIAHEFGNPLIGVHWLLKDINKLPSIDESTREMTNVALQECKRMRQFLSDFQKFTKKTTGTKELVDIHYILDSCLLFYSRFLHNNGINVVKQYDYRVPQVPAIKDQMNQVFVNLIMNAIQAIGLKGSKGGLLQISTAEEGDSISVTIQDSGPGITKENMDNIFEPFFSTKSDVEGMGLGLYVSYGIIQRHGGDIVVESDPGQGASFTVILPVDSSLTAE